MQSGPLHYQLPLQMRCSDGRITHRHRKHASKRKAVAHLTLLDDAGFAFLSAFLLIYAQKLISNIQVELCRNP